MYFGAAVCGNRSKKSYLTSERLERYMNSEVGGDMVSLGGGVVAFLPMAGEAQVVCRLATDVVVSHVHVELLGVVVGFKALLPQTNVVVRVYGTTGGQCEVVLV